MNEIRLVERDPISYKRVLEGVFNPPNSISTHVGNKGLLSYVQGLQECDTEYCLHFDDGMKEFYKQNHNSGIKASSLRKTALRST